MSYSELLNKILKEEKENPEGKLKTEEALEKFKHLEAEKLNSVGLVCENIESQVSTIKEKLEVIKRLVDDFQKIICDNISSASDLKEEKKQIIKNDFKMALKETINNNGNISECCTR